MEGKITPILQDLIGGVRLESIEPSTVALLLPAVSMGTDVNIRYTVAEASLPESSAEVVAMLIGLVVQIGLQFWRP